MALDTIGTEDSILDQLKTIVPRVYVSEHPNPQSPEYPYMIVYFGAPITSGTDRHIVSVKHDTQQAFVTVQVISDTDQSARLVYNAVRYALIGWQPDDSGAMVPGGGMFYSRVGNNAKPTLYYRESTYRYMTNLSWED